LGRAQKGPEPDYANEFDHAASELIRKFEEAWKVLSERAQIRIPQNLDELEHQIKQHKDFEDNLQVGMGNPYNIKLMTLLKRTRNPTLNFLILVFDRSIINSIK
jgi:hypothetical protein